MIGIIIVLIVLIVTIAVVIILGIVEFSEMGWGTQNGRGGWFWNEGVLTPLRTMLL